jgi:hypothetical protein
VVNFGPNLTLQGFPLSYRISLFPKRQDPIEMSPQWRTLRDMTIAREDIRISQHDDVSVFFDFLNSNNNPLDISGFQKITWIIAESVTGVVLITKTTDDNSFLRPSTYRGSVILTKSETGSLTPNKIFPDVRLDYHGKTLYHELKGINSGGQQQTMLRGSVIVEDTRISDA